MDVNTKIKKNLSVVVALVAVSGFVSGCAPYHSASVEQASQQVVDSLGCTDMKSLIFDSFYELVDEDQAIPSKLAVKDSLKIQIEKIRDEEGLSFQEADRLSQLEVELYNVVDILLDTDKGSIVTWKELIQKMIELEMEDQSTESIVEANRELNRSLQKIKGLSTDISCKMKSVATEVPVAATKLSLKNGIDHVVATAYQSCRVLDLPPIDAATSNVQGISIVGKHSDGIGSKREVTDLKALQNSHYYVRGIASESSCVSVRTNPLIYDYGGEPAVVSGVLNLFKNAGTGTAVLGVDCSAFVSTGIATAGLRYKPNLANKPIYVRQSSSKFIDAAKSGFTCFDNVTVTPKSSVQAGDVVGVKGHVVTIDRVGADPFALALTKKVADCSTLNYKNFDIDVAQSSPSKGGIGINKYKLRDYLDETTKMRTAFVEMGKQACLSKYQNKNIKPSNTEWGFIRHKGTTACLANRVALTNEACTQKCLPK